MSPLFVKNDSTVKRVSNLDLTVCFYETLQHLIIDLLMNDLITKRENIKFCLKQGAGNFEITTLKKYVPKMGHVELTKISFQIHQVVSVCLCTTAPLIVAFSSDSRKAYKMREELK